MKNYLNINSLILTLASLILFSCEKEIDVDLHSSEPKIVIEGFISAENTAKIKISKSKNYDDNSNYPNLKGATVILTDDLGTQEELHLSSSDDSYVTQTMKGEVGRTYELYIKVEGKEYTANSYLPKSIKADSLYLYRIPAAKKYYPMLSMNDPKGVENYYRYLFKINDRAMNQVIYVKSDEFQDGKQIQIPFFFDEKYNDDNPLRIGDLVRIEVQCIDKGAHDFFDTLANTAELGANPTSNIKGGALGYFSAYSFSFIEMLVDKD